jgi:hypothetical protein
MFDSERVAMRVANLQHRQETKDDKEIGLVEITMEINPLPPALAQELDPYMRSTLFTMSDAAVTAKLQGAEFDLSFPNQDVLLFMAPDQGAESFQLRDAEIGTFKARRSKLSTAWRLRFTVTCMPLSEHQLAQIVDSYLKTRYCTFAGAQPDLLASGDEAPSRPRRAARAAGAAASTH